MGGDVMKRIAFAILVAFAALSATTMAWADSSDSSISTTEAP
jgi:hypothetical protein